MPDDKRTARDSLSVGSYKVTISKDHVDVTVTSGKLAGRTARFIPTPPSAAYFNEKPQIKKSA